MVFGFFRKKKPQQAQPGAQPTTQNTNTQSPQKNKGKSPQKKQSQPTHFVANIPDSDLWMYDTVVQFLSSPTWRIPIMTFIDENCIVFDDEEENKFEYTDLHNAFKKLVERLVDEMLCELEISEEKLMEVLQEGIKDPEYKRTFEQLLIIDNFLVFKNLMIKRNKELELEALQQLNEQDQGKTEYAPPQDFHPQAQTQKQSQVKTPTMPKELEKLVLEKEQAEIAHAIALSLAVEQEKAKLLEQEDYELQEALKQSQTEYTKFQEVQKAQEIELERKRKIEEENERQRAEKEKQRLEKEKEKEKELAKLQKIKADVEAKKTQEAQQKQHESPQKQQESLQKDVIEEQKVEPLTDSSLKGKKLEPIKTNTKNLPPLVDEQKGSSLPPLRGNAKFDPLSMDQLQEEKNKINSKLQQIKQEEANKNETLEERKARLKAQRDLILAKKKAEREAELQSYEAQKGNKATEKRTPEISEAEAEKRREVYQKLKSDL